MKRTCKTKSIKIIDSSQHWDVEGLGKEWGGRRLDFTPRMGTPPTAKLESISQWHLDIACDLPEREGSSGEYIAGRRKTRSFAQLLWGRICPNPTYRPESVAQTEGLEIKVGILNSRFKNSLKLHVTFYVYLLMELGQGFSQTLKGPMM